MDYLSLPQEKVKWKVTPTLNEGTTSRTNQEGKDNHLDSWWNYWDSHSLSFSKSNLVVVYMKNLITIDKTELNRLFGENAKMTYAKALELLDQATVEPTEEVLKETWVQRCANCTYEPKSTQESEKSIQEPKEECKHDCGNVCPRDESCALFNLGKIHQHLANCAHISHFNMIKPTKAKLPEKITGETDELRLTYVVNKIIEYLELLKG